MAYWNGGGAVIDRTRSIGWPAPIVNPSIVPALPRDRLEARHLGPESNKLSRCPEIDCVRHLLPSDVIAMAELRATEVGVGADRVLIAAGAISEETYVTALAASLDLAFEPLNGRSREDCPLSDERMVEAATTGLLPLSDGDDVIIVVAPRLVESWRLVALANSGVHAGQRIRITSAARLKHFVTHHGAREIEHRAVEELRARHPEFSASAGRPRLMAAVTVIIIIALAAIDVPGMALTALELALGFVFLAWTGLRLLGLLSKRQVRRRPHVFTDDWLPTYTIIIALYREAATVEGLVAALRRLNYPALGSKRTKARR